MRSWSLHPEYAEVSSIDRGVERRRQAEAEHHAAVGRVDDAVVPEAGARVIGMALLLVLGADRGLEGLLLVRVPFLLLGGEAVALHLRQHVGGLVAAHDGDARVRPHPEEAGREGAAAHAVIADRKSTRLNSSHLGIS